MGLPTLEEDFIVPKSLVCARVIASRVADWAALPVAGVDHWTFMRAARGETAGIITLHFSATVVAKEIIGGPNVTYDGDYDSDSPASSQIYDAVGSGGVDVSWQGVSPAFVTLRWMFDHASLQSRIRAAGQLAITVTSPTPQDRTVVFSFEADAIAAATADDYVGAFSFFGASIPFIAFDNGTAGAPLFPAVTAAAISVV